MMTFDRGFRPLSVHVVSAIVVELVPVGLDHVDEVREGLLLLDRKRLEVPHQVLQNKNDVFYAEFVSISKLKLTSANCALLSPGLEDTLKCFLYLRRVLTCSW